MGTGNPPPLPSYPGRRSPRSTSADLPLHLMDQKALTCLPPRLGARPLFLSLSDLCPVRSTQNKRIKALDQITQSDIVVSLTYR